MEPAVLLQGITKAFGDTVALRAIELEVPRGALYGLIGPNGAGKTTCIRIIMAILFPDSGELAVLGRRSALDAKRRIGYLPEERGVYRKMRVGAFLTYMAGLKGVPRREGRRRMLRLLQQVGLEGTDRRRCDELSKGMLQRVQLIAALIHQPDLLILDEPFSGLDPVTVRLLRDVILEQHSRGVTILLSTHAMAQAEDLCDHVVMIHHGAKVLDEPLASLRRRINPRVVRFEPMEPSLDLAPFAALPGVAGIRRISHGFELTIAAGANPAPIIRQLAAMATPLRLEVARPSLEDVFIELASADRGDTGNAPQMGSDLRGEDPPEPVA